MYCCALVPRVAVRQANIKATHSAAKRRQLQTWPRLEEVERLEVI